MTKKILVVDDDIDVRHALGIRLHASGYEVSFASDGVVAVSRVLKEKPDAIILDIGLPGGDGLQVLDRLKALMPLAPIPVIVLSAKDPSIFKERSLAAGAEAFFEKPADNDELLSAIEGLVERAKVQSESEPGPIEEKPDTILIVDDDQDLLHALNVRMQASGYKVVLASDSVGAISTAQVERPDLIVLDIGLPGGDGLQVMRRLKIIGPLSNIPVVILTAKDPTEIMPRAFESGAKAFLQKPVDNDELLETIRKTLEEYRSSEAKAQPPAKKPARAGGKKTPRAS